MLSVWPEQQTLPVGAAHGMHGTRTGRTASRAATFAFSTDNGQRLVSRTESAWLTGLPPAKP